MLTRVRIPAVQKALTEGLAMLRAPAEGDNALQIMWASPPPSTK